MIKCALLGLSILFLLVGCYRNQGRDGDDAIVSVQLLDRNGFQETISTPERIAQLERIDYLAPQPYQKIVRLFKHNAEGKSISKLTTYHDNGHIWQYLEVVNGRACGTFREWHVNGQLKIEARVIEGIGDFSDEALLSWVFDGLSRAWDEQGHLAAEFNYERGALSGESRYFHPNGEVKKKVPFVKDRQHGRVEYFNEEGELIGHSEFCEGIRDGSSHFHGDARCPAYEEVYEKGLLMEGLYSDHEGNCIAEIHRASGVQAIYKEGFLERLVEFDEGIPSGRTKVYDEKGSLRSEFEVKEGQKHGEEKIYDAHGKLKLSIHWVEDEMQGLVRSWYPNGQLQSEKEMYQNKKHGHTLAWYLDGSLMLVEQYEKDSLLNGKYFERGAENPISRVDQGTGVVTLFGKEGHLLRKLRYEKGHILED